MKMVLKVPTVCKNCSSCILTTVSRIHGVKSLSYDDDKSTLTVIGEVDVVVVVNALRKAKHPATVLSVSDEKKEAAEAAAKKKKEEEEAKKKKEKEEADAKKKKEEEEAKKKKCLQSPMMYCGDKPPCCGPPLMPQRPPYACYEVVDCPSDPSCTIM